MRAPLLRPLCSTPASRRRQTQARYGEHPRTVYARFPAADSHAGQAQPPRWPPRHWPGARPDSRGKLRPWAAPAQNQLGPSKSTACTLAAPPDPDPEENQTNDQDDSADEQQGQRQATRDLSRARTC